MMSWAKEYHLRGAASIITFILWILVAIMGILALVALMHTGGPWVRWYCSILFVLLATYKLFLARFVVSSNRYKLLSKTYGVTEWIRTTEFTEDAIVLTDHNSISKHQYSNINTIKEHNDAVTIFLNNNMALRIYKSTFVEGSWEECKNFLACKTKE